MFPFYLLCLFNLWWTGYHEVFYQTSLSWLLYSWKLSLKRNIAYIISKDSGSTLVNFLLKSGTVTTLKVLSVQADFQMENRNYILAPSDASGCYTSQLGFGMAMFKTLQETNQWLKSTPVLLDLQEKARGKTRRERGRIFCGKYSVIRSHVLVPVLLSLVVQI